MNWEERTGHFAGFLPEEGWLRIASILEVFGVSGTLTLLSQVLKLSDHAMEPIAGSIILFGSLISLMGSVIASINANIVKCKDKKEV